MIKKYGLFVFAMTALFSNLSLAYEMEASELVGKKYQFLPNQPVVLKNSLPFKLSISCTVMTEEPIGTLEAVGLYKKVTVNGKELKAGDTVIETIQNGLKLAIKAESFAEVQITNIGQLEVNVDCGLG